MEIFKSFDVEIKKAKINDKKINQIIQNYSFYLISNEEELKNKPMIIKKFEESKVIVVNQYLNDSQSDIFLIIGFDKTIIFINKSLLKIFVPLFSNRPDLPIYFLSDSESNFDITIPNKKLKFDNFFHDLIGNFNETFKFRPKLDHQIESLWKVVQSCMTGYLIKQAYIKIKEKQAKIDLSSVFDAQNNDYNISKFKEDDFIELQYIGEGSFSKIYLIYHIEKEELFALKKLQGNLDECSKLIEREEKNYSQINFPLLPKLYGIVKIGKRICLIIQFIDGQTLDNIEKDKFSFDDKIIILYEIMIIINYFHNKKFVYRDLKPNNVIIDDNKNVFIIDFDRMIKINDKDYFTNTIDFSSAFVAPEVNHNQISFKNDIYSIGQMISYIITEEDLSKQTKDINTKIHQISKSCKKECTEERPNLSSIMNEFLSYFILGSTCSDINKSIHYLTLAANQNDQDAQFNLGKIYYEGKYITRDINKSIHYYSLAANQNHPKAQYNLGVIYSDGEYIERDINKSIHYLTLAANQNQPEAQYNLGIIYYEGKYITRDINKSIYYLTLAANQNQPEAQYNLGIIYYEGKYITRDINKSIHYLSLAANQNQPKAQYNLGIIYYFGKYIIRDINKSIHYYSLAANQNHPGAQFNLGVIYFEGKYITRDINKSIHYFSLAANQNQPKAQFILGVIYYEGKYIERDINKSIYYLTLATNQNHPEAQFILGLIYYESEYITRDINKSIYYYSLAANQNHPNAQFILGLIYSEGKYITRDINKSIYYLSLAANQNHPKAQFILGVIYYEGKYITRDINKSIYYYSLAANKNDLKAQLNLGVIYSEGKYIERDINKSIHYFSLAANQNQPEAQYNLGVIYSDGEYITRDINKSIYYYSLAANQNHPNAQFILGFIYSEGKYITRDINKSIYYLSLAANQNHPKAQFILGLFYSCNVFSKKSIIKGIDYFIQSASNGDIEAHFAVGYFYNEGKYVEKDIKKSIHHYKEASSFNNQFAKNNLGIIYKHGFGEEIPQNVGYAIEYFEEAIRQKNDIISMYNLSHIYLYEYQANDKIDESIRLLIELSEQDYICSDELLCIAMIKKHGFDIDKIRLDLKNIAKTKQYSSKICQIIQKQQLLETFYFEKKYQEYKKIDFIYDFTMSIKPSYILNEKQTKEIPDNENSNDKNITADFYEGFELNI